MCCDRNINSRKMKILDFIRTYRTSDRCMKVYFQKSNQNHIILINSSHLLSEFNNTQSHKITRNQFIKIFRINNNSLWWCRVNSSLLRSLGNQLNASLNNSKRKGNQVIKSQIIKKIHRRLKILVEFHHKPYTAPASNTKDPKALAMIWKWGSRWMT